MNVQGEKSLFLRWKKSRESFVALEHRSSLCVYAQQLRPSACWKTLPGNCRERQNTGEFGWEVGKRQRGAGEGSSDGKGTQLSSTSRGFGKGNYRRRRQQDRETTTEYLGKVRFPCQLQQVPGFPALPRFN